MAGLVLPKSGRSHGLNTDETRIRSRFFYCLLSVFNPCFIRSRVSLVFDFVLLRRELLPDPFEQLLRRLNSFGLAELAPFVLDAAISMIAGVEDDFHHLEIVGVRLV